MIISLQAYKKQKLQEAQSKVNKLYEEGYISMCLEAVNIQASAKFEDLENSMVIDEYYK